MEGSLEEKLFYSVLQEDQDTVLQLVSQGANPNKIACHGKTSLGVAVKTGNKNLVKILLDACASSSTAKKPSPQSSTKKRYSKSHKRKLNSSECDETVVKCKNISDRTFKECQIDESDSLIVNNGACLEARDTGERTALYLAAGRGHLDVVLYLVSVGANVNGEEIHGYTPLCEAVWQRSTDVVEILLASGARVTHSHKLLHNAIIQRQEEIVTMLANLGGGINLHNDNGDTPLLLTVRLCQPAVARILLEKGANVNLCNSITGASALHIAVESLDYPEDFQELLACLIEYKIDLNATALTGDTALNRALLLHKDFAAVLLIRHGCDVNACDLHSCGLDNLSIASRRRSISLASMLLKAGHYFPIPDPNNSIPKEGTTKNWLYHICKHPPSLFDICRITIRRFCKKRPLFSYVHSLPLPKSLKGLLMLEDEGNLDNIIITTS
ncbi:jg9327 [Pararge aegeria aegeria]|uniref:Jg9327 protein n=1 Tax=Pararge aegeria aegeria TaxID=348720 RepID=A0A8S4RX14_9NEOP|nr:jg9327 [Pararge aegeria aegeria]